MRSGLQAIISYDLKSIQIEIGIGAPLAGPPTILKAMSSAANAATISSPSYADKMVQLLK
jgi:hypothetical protein